MSDADLYEGREQTFVKHLILKRYLQPFARIIGRTYKSITYVDGFSGPWESKSEDYADTSFSIAIKELRDARDSIQPMHRPELRCLFLEKDPDAFARLQAFLHSVNDVEVAEKNLDFEAAVPEILRFIGNRPRNFTFIFVDPTGWKGFGRKAIGPLLSLPRCEVLINFMTGHIRRFIELVETEQGFEELFGSPSFKKELVGLHGQDREDAIVDKYMDCLREAGEFAYVCPAMVLHPTKDRTHFHLIYATRSLKGVKVFKDAEKRAMREMEIERTKAQQRSRMDRTGARSLFPADALPPSAHYDDLRRRYTQIARDAVTKMLREKQRVPYDDVWIEALRHPMVWESDLLDWIRDWQATGKVGVSGLKPREKVPKTGQNHWLEWLG